MQTAWHTARSANAVAVCRARWQAAAIGEIGDEDTACQGLVGCLNFGRAWMAGWGIGRRDVCRQSTIIDLGDFIQDRVVPANHHTSVHACPAEAVCRS